MHYASKIKAAFNGRLVLTAVVFITTIMERAFVFDGKTAYFHRVLMLQQQSNIYLFFFKLLTNNLPASLSWPSPKLLELSFIKASVVFERV